MTKDQLIHFLAGKKASKLINNATWGDLTSAVSTLTAEEKDAIAKGVASGSLSAVEPLSRLIQTNLMAQANAAATAALSDDNLTLAELDDLL